MSVDYKHSTSELTLGNGELLVNGIGVGYLNGDDSVKFKGGYDLEKFKHGNPKAVVAVFNKESMMELTAPVMQINPANFCLAMGGLTSAAASSGTDTKTDQVKVMANFVGAPGFQAIVLDGPNVTSVTVKTSGGTTISASGNYYLHAASGIIYALPGGSITSNQSLKITYTHDVVESYQVDIGNLQQLSRNSVLFRHLRSDKTLVEIYMDYGINSNPFEIDFNSNKLIQTNVMFEALWHEGNSRLGYIKFTPNVANLQVAPVIS